MTKIKEMEKVTAKIVTEILNKELKKDTNRTACVFLYQPKVPKELTKFKKR